MNEDINLLVSRKDRYQTHVIQKMQLFRLVAIALLFGVSVLSMILFILITFSPLPRLQQEETALRNTFTTSDLGAKFTKYHITNERLQDISSVLKKRTDVVGVYDVLRKNISTDATIDVLRIEKKEVLMTISSNDLEVIEESLTRLRQNDIDTKAFTNIVISRISFDPDTSNYRVLFQITVS